MTPPVLSEAAIAARADLPRLVCELEAALAAGQHERARIPLREVIDLDEPRAAFLSMPAVSRPLGLYITKVATVFDRAPGDPRPVVSAVVAAFSARTGELLAILDGAAVTALRCAAAAALVTDRCARVDARILAIAGTGVQARQQAIAVCAVRPIEEIRVWSHRLARAAAFAEELRGMAAAGGLDDRREVRVSPWESLDEAVRDADVIGTATASRAPIGGFAALAPDVHVNCMGGHALESRELPLEVLRSSTLVVEDVPTAVREAGPVHAGAISLGELVARDVTPLRAGRTVFSSTGHAFLDLIATAHLLRDLPAGDPTP